MDCQSIIKWVHVYTKRFVSQPTLEKRSLRALRLANSSIMLSKSTFLAKWALDKPGPLIIDRPCSRSQWHAV